MKCIYTTYALPSLLFAISFSLTTATISKVITFNTTLNTNHHLTKNKTLSNQINMPSLMDDFAGMSVAVRVGEVRHINFFQKPAIGTEFINGGTVLIVACPTKAIMAHIAKLPPVPSVIAINRSLVDVEGMMAGVRSLFDCLQTVDGGNHFQEQDTKTMILAAKNSNGELKEKNHVDEVVLGLRRMELVPEITPYTYSPSPSADTSVLALNMDFGLCQEMPKIFVGGEPIEW